MRYRLAKDAASASGAEDFAPQYGPIPYRVLLVLLRCPRHGRVEVLDHPRVGYRLLHRANEDQALPLGNRTLGLREGRRDDASDAPVLESHLEQPVGCRLQYIDRS